MHTVDIKSLAVNIESEIGEPCRLRAHIHNEQVLALPSRHLQRVVNILTERHGVQHLSTITAQIKEDAPDQIQLLYHFWKGTGISLLISLEKHSPTIDSIVAILPGADFYEREVAEMYGIHFNLRKHTPPLLLPENWNEGPPMLTERDNE